MSSETSMREVWKLFVGLIVVFGIVGVYMFVVMPFLLNYVMAELFGKDMSYWLSMFVYVYVTGINFIIFHLAGKRIKMKIEESSKRR